ncbi:MAG: hypothetical protein WA715_00740 [Candidatus Acidiferrum sp.]
MLATAWAFSYSLNAQELKPSPPNLDLILDSLEQTERQNPALSRHHEMTWQYRIFRGDDPKPSSEVTARIIFTPPDNETFKITEERGNPTGKKIVHAVLEQEIAASKAGHKGDIDRSNYDFVFLREQDFGSVREYVLHIIPRREERGLLLGDIWVDAKTYRIRQIVGIPLKPPSFWIKDLHITVQFALVNGMWIAASVDAIATVWFLGIHTLTGRDLASPSAAFHRFDDGSPVQRQTCRGGNHGDHKSVGWPKGADCLRQDDGDKPWLPLVFSSPAKAAALCSFA